MNLWYLSNKVWTVLVCEQNGIIVEGPPIVRWAIGKRLSVLVRRCDVVQLVKN